MRISAEQRQQNETQIRAVMDRLLSGEIPPGGKCDIKTLAREAAVDRTAFYGTRPYARLREEFEARLRPARRPATSPTPRRPDRPPQGRDHHAQGTPGRPDATITELTTSRTWPSPGSPPSTTRSPGCAARSSKQPASARLPAAAP